MTELVQIASLVGLFAVIGGMLAMILRRRP